MAKKKKKARRLIECPICGQSMKRITNTHLRQKHGMSMEEFQEKYGAVSPSEDLNLLDLSDPDSMPAITDTVVRNILSDDQIDNIAQQVIHNLLKDHDARFRVALNLFAVRRIQTVGTLYEQLEDIRELLLDPARLADMSDSNLAKVYQIMEKSMSEALDYVKKMSVDRNKGVDELFNQTNTVINIFEHDPDAPEPPESPRSRDRLREFWKALEGAGRSDLVSAGPDGPVIDVPVQEAPEDGAQEEEEEETSHESGNETTSAGGG